MVRMPRINKQSFKYSLYLEKSIEYKTDEDGNPITVKVKGKDVPIEKEIPAHYTEPIEFKASIQMAGGESQAIEFGVNVSDYSAIITTPKGMLPITETSIIWFGTNPTMRPDGFVDEHTADYKVIKKSSTLNYDRYILQRAVN